MKRLLLPMILLGIVLAGCVPCPAFAQQSTPPGAGVKSSNFTSWLNKKDYSWGGESLMNDTIAVSAAVWTKIFAAPNGNINLSYTAVLAAGTDSMKHVLYKTNHSQGNLDTLKVTAIDSTKTLTAGYKNYVFVCNGKWGPNLLIKSVPLNTTGGKVTDFSIGAQ